jgi:hypothetical protein
MESLAEAITAIEMHRRSRLLIIAASHLDLDLLPPLFDTLKGIGEAPRLDLLLYCSGGEIGGARRIGLMLQQSSERLAIIVPDRCRSAGTILALAADEILAGRAAIFTPVDPLLQAGADADNDAPQAISTEDVRRFGEAVQAWFGFDQKRARTSAFEAMTGAIFPPTLTAFYRASLEAELVCRELLSKPMGRDAERTAAIVSKLVSGFQSHGFPLSREDLRDFGLPVTEDNEVEERAWAIAALLRSSIGGGARGNEQEEWFDACIATRDSCRVRRRSSAWLMPRWESAQLSEHGVHAIHQAEPRSSTSFHRQ